MKLKVKILVISMLICFFVHGSTFNLPLKTGWNLTSIPLYSLTVDSFSPYVPLDMIYKYTSFGYTVEDTILTSGTGYWVLSLADQIIPLTGTIDSCIDMPRLETGWNMNGAPFGVISDQNYKAYYSDTSDIGDGIYYFDPVSRHYNEADFIFNGMGL